MIMHKTAEEMTQTGVVNLQASVGMPRITIAPRRQEKRMNQILLKENYREPDSKDTSWSKM